MWSWIGCNGRGVAFAIDRATGRELAAAIDGVSLDDLALPLTEPKPIAFHAIGRKVAPYVLAWYRRKDRVEPSV